MTNRKSLSRKSPRMREVLNDNGDRWRLMIIFGLVSIVMGITGGAGFRAIDPTRYTLSDAVVLQNRFNDHLIHHPDRELDRRIIRIELLLNQIRDENSAMTHQITEHVKRLATHMDETRHFHQRSDSSRLD